MRGAVLSRSRTWLFAATAGVLAFFVFLLILAISHHNTTIYPKSSQLLAAIHGDQCERPVDKGWMVEPQNTLTNLGYWLAGLVILFRVTSWAGHLFAINLLLLAIMSGIYHATLDTTPQIYDVAWVYAALLSLSIYASFVHTRLADPFAISWRLPAVAVGVWLLLAVIILGVFNMKEVGALVVLTGVVVIFEALCFLLRPLPVLTWGVAPFLFIAVGFLGYKIRASFGWDSDAVFPIIIAVLLLQLAFVFAGAQALPWATRPWGFWVLVGSLAIGVTVRLSDGYGKDAARTPKLLCFPDNPLFQGHALWHLCGALAFLLGYDLLARLSANTGDQLGILSEDAAA